MARLYRLSRTVALVVDYLKKLKNPARIIDTRVFNQVDINARIFMAMAHRKKTIEDIRGLFGINADDPPHIKACKAPPTYESLNMVSGLLGVSMQWLLTGWATTEEDEEIPCVCTSAHIEHADNSTIMQNTHAENIIIHQHFPKCKMMST